MSEKKSLKLNVVMNAVLNMSAFIFPFITLPYVSRVLGPEGTGSVNFATSLIDCFLIVAQLGIPTYGVRACAKVRDDKRLLTKTAHELLIINVVMMLVAYAALAGALILVPRLHEDRLLYIVCSATILFTSIGMEWLYKALEQYTYITVRSIVFKAISIVTMFLLVRSKEHYVIYGGITIMAASASGLMNFVHARKYISMRPMGGYQFKPHLKAVAIFFAMSCASRIYTHLDTLMLGFMTTETNVGYYGVAVRIKQILVSLVTSQGVVLLPRATHYIKNKQMDKFQDISRKSIGLTLLTSLPLMLYLMMFAWDGIHFISGDEYAGAVMPLRLIMPTLLFIGLSNVTGIQILVPMGREKTVLYSIICGAITDLLVNLALIPKYGAVGAAIAASVAELVVLIFQMTVLWKLLKQSLKKIAYWKVLTALVVAAGVSFWVLFLSLNHFFILTISACLFFGSYALTLLVVKEELVADVLGQLMKKFLKK